MFSYAYHIIKASKFRKVALDNSYLSKKDNLNWKSLMTELKPCKHTSIQTGLFKGLWTTFINRHDIICDL